MKRFLSLILTLALVLSLIPTVFADSEAPKEQMFEFSAKSTTFFFADETNKTDDFEFLRSLEGENYYVNSVLTDYNGRDWKFFDVQDAHLKKVALTNYQKYFSLITSLLQVSGHKNHIGSQHFPSFALLLKAKETGFYVPEFKVYNGSRANATLALHMAPVGNEKSMSSYINSDNKIMNIHKGEIAEGDVIGEKDGKDVFLSTDIIPVSDGDRAIYTKSGDEYVTVFTNTAASCYKFIYLKLVPVINAEIEIKINDILDAVELDMSDNNTAEITDSVINGSVDTKRIDAVYGQETGIDVAVSKNVSIPATKGSIEYKSSDENVAKVDANGKITAVGGGTAKVYAQSPDGLVKSNEIEITVTAPSTEDEALTNAFEVKKEELKDYVAPSVVSVSAGGSVITPEKNTDGSYDIEASAVSKDGAKFLYWAKGLKTNKKIVSFSNKLENYVPEEDGADWLIAVYDDMLPANDEYYNANGQLIATGEKPALPSMAGYGAASEWKQYGNTNIYVAEYNRTQPDSVNVTVNGETKTVPYGTEITCTATDANFKCWTKSNINGKTEIVSTENVYKFKAWEDCSVDVINEAYNYNGDTFKIVVDSFGAGNETGIMAEFIGFGNNVVEKGIMWNNKKIAMTKPGSQFSVVADKNGEYKGYAIVGNATDGYTLITDGSVTVSDAE